MPTTVAANTCAVGAYFNSFTLNDSVTTNSSPTTIAALETALNDQLDYAVYYTGLSPDQVFGQFDQWVGIKAFLDAGRPLVVNLAFSGTHAQINTGHFDSAISQFGTILLAYVAANSYTGPLIIKFLHEGNATVNYPWCVFTSTNLAAAGGSVATSTANYLAAYQRVASRLRTACTTGGICYIKTVFEIADQQDQSVDQDNAFISFATFYPGDAYVDIVSVNVYNRFNLGSGVSFWCTLERLMAPILQSIRRFAPSKPIMIGECSSNDDGQIVSVAVTSGGSGYSGATTIHTNGPGAGATFNITVAGGVITSVTPDQPGRQYNDATVLALSNVGSGSGATFTVTTIGQTYDKASWYLESMEWVRDQTDIQYFTWFFTNSGTASGSPGVTPADYRMWCPNTAREKTLWRQGRNALAGRVKAKGVDKRGGVVNANFCPDPFANDITEWKAAGSNVGSLARTTAATNNPNLDPGPSEWGGAIRLTHNGTVGLPETNRMYCNIPTTASAPAANWQLSFWARFKPTVNAASGTAYLAAGIEVEDGSGSTSDGNNTLREALPPFALTPQWERYTCSAHTYYSTTGWRLVFAIGAGGVNGQFFVTNVKLERGLVSTPLMPVNRQINRTTVQDVNYDYNTNMGTDEMLAYTTLTTSRTITLPDARTLPPGTSRIIKDESGACSNLIGITVVPLGNTGQRIDGAITASIKTAYGSLRLYTGVSSSGVVTWFSV